MLSEAEVVAVATATEDVGVVSLSVFETLPKRTLSIAQMVWIPLMIEEVSSADTLRKEVWLVLMKLEDDELQFSNSRKRRIK